MKICAIALSVTAINATLAVLNTEFCQRNETVMRNIGENENCLKLIKTIHSEQPIIAGSSYDSGMRLVIDSKFEDLLDAVESSTSNENISKFTLLDAVHAKPLLINTPIIEFVDEFENHEAIENIPSKITESMLREIFNNHHVINIIKYDFMQDFDEIYSKAIFNLNTEEVDKLNNDMIYLSIVFKSSNIFKYLLEKDSKLSNSLINDDLAAIHFASKMNFCVGIDVLIENHVNVNLRDRLGRNPIWYAVKSKAYEAALNLLKARATPWLADEMGVNSVMVATENIDYRMVRLLLYHGKLPKYLVDNATSPEHKISCIAKYIYAIWPTELITKNAKEDSGSKQLQENLANWRYFYSKNLSQILESLKSNLKVEVFLHDNYSINLLKDLKTISQNVLIELMHVDGVNHLREIIEIAQLDGCSYKEAMKLMNIDTKKKKKCI